MSRSELSPKGTPELTPTNTQGNTEQPSALSTAISLWRAGRRIDRTLREELVEQGYDVPSLERFYSR